jgi:hypothetical protein
MIERRPRPRRLAAETDATESQPSPERWQTYLAAELACTVRVVFTRARKKPLQVRPGPKRTQSLEVRMHAFFATAPPEIERAVASWIRSGRRAPRACVLLDRWILESLEKLPAPDVRESALRARGECYDLAALAADLARKELADAFPSASSLPRLTWGRQGPSRTRHSIRLGSYDQEGGVVRIHTALDQPAVPEFFVRYVLFHELLHAVHPPRKGDGARWIHHGREFKKREKAYPDYARAIAWEKAHIKDVIRSARRGTPMSGPVAARAPEPAVPTAARTSIAGLRRVLQGWLFPE